MTALDTSVAIASLVSWHEHHDVCRRAATGARAPAHVVLETYSVLTRLPAPHRLDGHVAADLLSARFRSKDVLAASLRLQRSLVAQLAEVGLEGGATYDGYVGLTAAAHGELLLSRDRRAARTYELLAVPFELVEPDPPDDAR